MDGTRGILTYHPRLWLCVYVRVYVCVTGSERRSPPTGSLFFFFPFCTHPIRRRAALASLCQPPLAPPHPPPLTYDYNNHHNKHGTTGTTLGAPLNSSLPLLSAAKLVRSFDLAGFPESQQGLQSHLTL